MSVWPNSLAVSEGCANAKAGGWVSLLVTVVVAWVAVVVGLSNALEVSALVRAEREWIEAGAFVMVVEPDGDDPAGGIAVAACEGLAEVEGISAAFAATITASVIEPTNAPGTVTTLAHVSPGVFEFVGAQEVPEPALLGVASTAESTGLVHGERAGFVQVDPSKDRTSFMAVLLLVDRADLGPSLEGSFLLPTLISGRADHCYLRTDASHAQAVAGFAAESLSYPGGRPAVVRSLLSANTYGLDFGHAYSERILGKAWLAGALVLVAMWALIQRTRRPRSALYQTFGVHTRARMLMQLSEWLALSLPGLAWGWGIATVLAVAAGAEPGVLLLQITLQLVATWCAASLGVLVISLVPVGSLLDALKDRT